jgi:hypothetical protein
MTGQQLYIIDSDGMVKPATWAEYDQWEQELSPTERCPLGKKLKVDVVGSVTITTLFCLSAIVFYGHRPQLFVTLAVGDGVWITSVYTSHRACLSGHRDIVSKIKKGTATKTSEPVAA